MRNINNQKGLFMKFTFSIFLLALLTSSLLFAQDSVPTKMISEISVSSGLTFPSIPREFKNYWDQGMSVGIGLGHEFQPGDLGYSSVHATVEYHNFPFSESKFRDAKKMYNNNIKVEGDSRSVINVMLLYKGTFSKLSEVIQPYFHFGIGYYNASSFNVSVAQQNAPLTDSVSSAFAWSFGCGIDIPVIDKFTFFTEVKSFVAATGDYGTQFYPVCLGVRYKP